MANDFRAPRPDFTVAHSTITPTVAVICSCNGVLVMLTRLAEIVTCGGCGAQYTIGSVAFDIKDVFKGFKDEEDAATKLSVHVSRRVPLITTALTPLRGGRPQ